MKNHYQKNIIVTITVIVIFIGVFIAKSLINEDVVKKFAVEEGCYINEKNNEHLLCFTRNAKFYNVLKKNNEYYNDLYYMNPPENDDDYKKYSYDYEFQKNRFILNMTSKSGDHTIQNCTKTDETSFNCEIKQVISDETETEEQKYHKIDITFDESVISSLPKYERVKEYQINFDGKMLKCNLPWSYSIVNTSAGTVAIKNCLEKSLDDSYTVTSYDEDKEGNWIIYGSEQKKRIEKLFPYAYSQNLNDIHSQDLLSAINYIKLNYSYEVSVDNQKFGVFESFPIDPYDQKDIMTVDIVSTKENKEEEYGLYELKYNKIYMPDNEGWGLKFYDSKKGVDILYPTEPDIRYESKFTYKRTDNNIYIDYEDPFAEDRYCKILSDDKITCQMKTYWAELTAK